ncbi:MAG TPA: hypothetical protein CFH84_04600 [Sulfurimonas sp. UBA12504]|nr:MAG: hypothetical protein A2019_09685 [Sulfurimonas sp. GWF2_37_8]DAB30333.1 MAG TPA: hypothetical protein CFH84_04600 [Sulfurimonas sp. UBA12504]
MAVKHINENAKEESGILLSGADATKVFSMFSDNKSSKCIQEKTDKLKFLIFLQKNLFLPQAKSF